MFVNTPSPNVTLLSVNAVVSADLLVYVCPLYVIDARFVQFLNVLCPIFVTIYGRL